MQPDDEAPLTLTKWPFYLGDILLVAAALAIAILGNWQLTDMQVVSCVVAVALGNAIFVLPYLVEYWMRLREVEDDRSSEIRLLKGYMQKSETAVQQCHERLVKLESGPGGEDQRYELLATALDHKLEAAAQTVATLAQQVEQMDASKGEPVEALAALRSELAAAETKLQEALQPITLLEERLTALEVAVDQSATVVSEDLADEPKQSRAPRTRRVKADSNLLERAISEPQDSAATAVNRIIDSKAKLLESASETEMEAEVDAAPPAEAKSQESIAPSSTLEKAEVPELEATPERTSDAEPEAPQESVQEAEPTVEIEPVVPSLEAEQPEELIVELDPETIEESADVDLEMVDVPQVAVTINEPAESIDSASEDDQQTAVEAAPTKADTTESAESADMFGEAVPEVRKRARTKANDAVLTVSAFIGIGNKPFLRGSGGGLNWESGVPMDFQEIGKWRWVAPADLEEPVEVQVYRNDEDADRKGRHVLEPSQKLEVSPVF